ncbi:MAG: RNA 2',3'-cyclic phosphodiesterase [Candidatus Bipolaricaulota bacterium]
MVAREDGKRYGGAIIHGVRLFFCVELPDAVRAELGRATGGLRARLGAGTWVAEENLHITLRFLGEVGEDSLPGLRDLGRAVASATPPFELNLDRLGAFPSPHRARVLWAGPTGDSPPFSDLARRVEDGVQALGFPPETKPAHPHVTMARLRVPQDVASHVAAASVALKVRVDGLTLMTSELRPQGPLYTPVERWRLGV